MSGNTPAQLRAARHALAVLQGTDPRVLDSTRVMHAVRLLRAPTAQQPELLTRSPLNSTTARGATPQAVDHASPSTRLAVAARAAYGEPCPVGETRP